jgi:hypothetical protein
MDGIEIDRENKEWAQIYYERTKGGVVNHGGKIFSSDFFLPPREQQ